MLAAADRLAPTSTSPLRPAVMRLAVVLLYTAGLRRGELLRLTLADVDPRHGILHIRVSKFHKSRIVPLSPDAARELRSYLRKRLRPPLSCSSDSPLLCNSKGRVRGYTGTGIRQGVQALFRAANVCGTDGRTPRVHDFRHSFAVGSLLRWYQQGADVQSNLPKLAMYMGHVSIVSTEPAFADAGRADNGAILVVFDPVSLEQHVEQAAVEPTGCTVVDILGHGMMTQLCLAKTQRQAPVVTPY
ncbi:integrase [Bradyrhizobium sp. USDA 4503]